MRIEHAVASLPANGSGPVFLLLHGWGSNEHDLPGLLDYCAPGADYASLRAPISYGPGYTWFGSWDYEGVPTGESLDRQSRQAGLPVSVKVPRSHRSLPPLHLKLQPIFSSSSISFRFTDTHILIILFYRK